MEGEFDWEAQLVGTGRDASHWATDEKRLEVPVGSAALQTVPGLGLPGASEAEREVRMKNG